MCSGYVFVQSNEYQPTASGERLTRVLFISNLLFNDINIIFEIM